ncbi:MAG: hypothetical protein AABN34_16305 [Acidobacteriota bacterium]
MGSQDFKGPSDRATEVKHLRLCPRKLLLYVGEAFTLVPLPLDRNKEVVHGAALTWETKDPNLASVSSWGEVSASAPGHTQVAVNAGTTKAHVNVEVRAGLRPRLSDRRQGDLDWDAEHGHDCDDPEAAQMAEPQPTIAAELISAATASAGTLAGRVHTDSVSDEGRMSARQSFKSLARPAALRQTRSTTKHTVKFTTGAGKLTGRALGRSPFLIEPILDGDNPDSTATAAAAPYNAVGSPRFGAVEFSEGSATKTKNLLGSYDYVFSAPVLGLPGRGLDVNLALTGNSRVWSKEPSGMMFNYGKDDPRPDGLSAMGGWWITMTALGIGF